MSSVKQSDTRSVFLYLLYTTPTCFGHISWPSLGSYKFARRVPHMWQVVTNS